MRASCVCVNAHFSKRHCASSRHTHTYTRYTHRHSLLALLALLQPQAVVSPVSGRAQRAIAWKRRRRAAELGAPHRRWEAMLGTSAKVGRRRLQLLVQRDTKLVLRPLMRCTGAAGYKKPRP